MCSTLFFCAICSIVKVEGLRKKKNFSHQTVKPFNKYFTALHSCEHICIITAQCAFCDINLSVEFVFCFFHFTEGSRRSSINNKMVEFKGCPVNHQISRRQRRLLVLKRAKRSHFNDKNGEIKSLQRNKWKVVYVLLDTSSKEVVGSMSLPVEGSWFFTSLTERHSGVQYGNFF